MFQNAAEFAALYPDADAGDVGVLRGAARPGSAELPAIRAALLARAETPRPRHRDPDLHLVVDGRAGAGAVGRRPGLSLRSCRPARAT